jgi:hypothetical protein
MYIFTQQQQQSLVFQQQQQQHEKHMRQGKKRNVLNSVFNIETETVKSSSIRGINKSVNVSRNVRTKEGVNTLIERIEKNKIFRFKIHGVEL